jgi:hypothetical protein
VTPPPRRPTDDRPRYRVLARRWTSPDPHPVPDAPTTGFELTVYRVDAASPDPVTPLGVTQTTDGHVPDPGALRARVVDWLRVLAAPLPCAATAADVELFLEARP